MRIVLWVCTQCEMPRQFVDPRCPYCNTRLVLKEFWDFEEEEKHEEDCTAGAQAEREQGPVGVIR